MQFGELFNKFHLQIILHDIFTSYTADFQIGDLTFEIGGKSKTKKQIQEVENAFIVKDDIEAGFVNTIPLWQFGLLY